MRSTRWLYQIEPGDYQRWGIDAVALAEVSRGGVPTLPAFVISSETVQEFLSDSRLRRRILHEIGSYDPKRPEHLGAASAAIRKAIRDTSFPRGMRHEVAATLDRLAEVALCRDCPLPLTLTLLPIGGTKEEVVSITGETNGWDDFSSLFTKLMATRFDSERLHGRLSGAGVVLPPAMAVMVTLHHPVQAAGTAKPYDPERHDGTVLYVTAHYHEDESLAHTSARDVYRFDRNTLLPLSREHSKHRWSVSKGGAHTKIDKSHSAHEAGVLTEEQQGRLTRMIRMAQKAFEDSHEYTWVMCNGTFYVTGARPLQEEGAAPISDQAAGDVLLPVPLGIGHPGNLGVATGPARCIRTAADKKSIQPGDVVIVKALEPSDLGWVSAAAALVSEYGISTGPEGSVAVRLGIPAVTALADARHHIHDGQMVTVDGTHGIVYAGKVAPQNVRERHYLASQPITGTQIHLTLQDPLHVDQAQLEGSDGIGLIRGEFLLHLVGVHPQELFAKKRDAEYAEILREVIERVVRLAYPHSVMFQLHDIHPGTFGNSRHEPNPKIGYRGTHRLLREPSLAELEVRTISDLHEKGLDAVRLMLPVVREVEEVMAAEELIRRSWSEGERLPYLWVRCETPAIAEAVSDLAALGIEGICFDIPMLTQLMTGVDGDNYQVAHHVDQTDPAVLELIDRAVRACREHGLTSMIIAEGEELVSEVVQVAVRAGVSQVSVPKEELGEMRSLVASLEQRVIFERALDA